MRDKGTMILAVLLIALGGYFLLNELNVGLPGLELIWPLLPVSAGIALVFGYLSSEEKDPEQVFFGTVATFVGLVFLAITLGPLTYSSLRDWWPVFVLIGGVAFLAQWAVAGFRDWDALFLALVALCIGGVSLAITLELLGPNTRETLPKLWPGALILAGLMALLRGLLGRSTE